MFDKRNFKILLDILWILKLIDVKISVESDKKRNYFGINFFPFFSPLESDDEVNADRSAIINLDESYFEIFKSFKFQKGLLHQRIANIEFLDSF